MNSVYDNVIANKTICNVRKKTICNGSLFIVLFSFRVSNSWNNGDDRDLILKLKAKLGVYK